MMPDREPIKAIIAKFHRNSCYPKAMDVELDMAADAILALAPADLPPSPDTVREALIEIDGCFEAALAEGWLDALANGDIDAIRDIWTRRISFARHPIIAALSSAPFAPAAPVAGTPDQWQDISTAPTSPDKEPPVVLLWVVNGGFRGEGCVAFGRCYRDQDQSVRGVPSGFLGFKVSHWQPMPTPPVARNEGNRDA